MEYLIIPVGLVLNLGLWFGYMTWRNEAVYQLRTRLLSENSNLYYKLPPYEKMMSSFKSLKTIEKEAREEYNNEVQ